MWRPHEGFPLMGYNYYSFGDYYYPEDLKISESNFGNIKFNRQYNDDNMSSNRDAANTNQNRSLKDNNNTNPADTIEKVESSGIKDELIDMIEINVDNGDPASLYYLYSQKNELERLGMTVTSGTVVIKKDQTNLIGISIGGGAPYCPCLYIVQIFDGTPASREGSLQSGDELLGVNGQSVKGKTKVAVAKMIQSTDEEVTIQYNKLHADPQQGETLDIALKKIKHRFVEGMSSSTADSLGLSRAILCNDSLVKRLQELQGTEAMYRGLVEHAKRMLKAYFDLLQTYQSFGNCFASISIREPQPRASEAFRIFGEMHRNMEKDGIKMLKAIKPVLSDLGTYLTKAIPDTKLTIRRYADSKFTYLSYCLKVKEMDDEEHSYVALQEPLYRVETGNYEYRLILRCRQEARARFAALRSDVLEKMELLESKHARDLGDQLKRFIQGLADLGTDNLNRLEINRNLFPVEVDLQDSAFQYKSTTQQQTTFVDENGEDEVGEEASENKIISIEKSSTSGMGNLIPGFENVDLGEQSDIAAKMYDDSAGLDLLHELGLDDVDLTVNSSTLTTPIIGTGNKNFHLLD